MTTPLLEQFATVTIGGNDFTQAEGEISLDTRRVPYGRATLTLPLVDPADVENIDPRDGLRALLTAGDERAGTSRVFDLAIRRRRANHQDRTILVDLATDEALLTDYAVLYDDAGARAHEGSLRAVVDYVLAKIGAHLEPGGPDADVTAYWAVTNLLLNPSVEGSLGNWSAAGNCTTFHASIGRSGTASCGFTSSAAGVLAVSPMSLSGRTGVQQGRSYVFSGYGRRGVSSAIPAGSTVTAVIRWVNADGGTPWADVMGNPAAINNTDWAPRSVAIGEAPAGAVAAFPFFRVTGATAGGQIGYLDDAMFYEGDEAVPFFHPTAAPAPGYTLTWSNAANASTSTRTPDVERLPELFVWRPGMTAWQFLEPLTAQAGYWLHCDEQRRWFLNDPATWTRPGQLSVSGWNATEGDDEIALDNPEVYATGVVVRYSWKDAAGLQREQTDAAGAPGLVRVIELDRAYPGPGLASAVLSRMTGRGRVQSVTALANWNANPGMAARITLPGTYEQAGQVAHVAWNLSDGLMRIETNALTDIIPGSIAALLGTIDTLTGTIDDL